MIKTKTLILMVGTSIAVCMACSTSPNLYYTGGGTQCTGAQITTGGYDPIPLQVTDPGYIVQTPPGSSAPSYSQMELDLNSNWAFIYIGTTAYYYDPVSTSAFEIAEVYAPANSGYYTTERPCVRNFIDISSFGSGNLGLPDNLTINTLGGLYYGNGTQYAATTVQFGYQVATANGGAINITANQNPPSTVGASSIADVIQQNIQAKKFDSDRVAVYLNPSGSTIHNWQIRAQKTMLDTKPPFTPTIVAEYLIQFQATSPADPMYCSVLAQAQAIVSNTGLLTNPPTFPYPANAVACPTLPTAPAITTTASTPSKPTTVGGAAPKALIAK